MLPSALSTVVISSITGNPRNFGFADVVGFGVPFLCSTVVPPKPRLLKAAIFGRMNAPTAKPLMSPERAKRSMAMTAIVCVGELMVLVELLAGIVFIGFY